MGSITDKEMGQRIRDFDQWFTDPAPRGSGRLLGRISSKGDRSFYFRYSRSDGARDTMLIGKYRSKEVAGYLTLKMARARAAELSLQYRECSRDLRQYLANAEAERVRAIDELARKAEEDARVAVEMQALESLEFSRRSTVTQLFERWTEAELAPHIGGDGKRIGRKDGGAYTKAQFARRIFPTLGDVPIADIRKADVLAILDGVKAEGKLRTANTLLADLKQMFKFAAEREVIGHSPIELIQKRKIGGKDIKRDRALSVDELTLLASKLGTSHLDRRSALGILIILATGCRLGELMGAVWADSWGRRAELLVVVDQQNVAHGSGGLQLGSVDLVSRIWHLPTTKNQREHNISLSTFAHAYFEELLNLRGVDAEDHPVPWVFPNSKMAAPVAIKTLGKQLADRQRGLRARLRNRTTATHALELPGGRWTAHDLRRTSSTIMSQLGVSNDVINECHNHIKSGMSGVYIQDRRLAEQKAAFEALGVRLSQLGL